MENGAFTLEFSPDVGCVLEYRQYSNIRRTLVDNKIVDHSDVAPTGDAPTTSSFST